MRGIWRLICAAGLLLAALAAAWGIITSIVIMIWILGSLLAAAVLVVAAWGIACEAMARGEPEPGWQDDITVVLARAAAQSVVSETPAERWDRLAGVAWAPG
jgi:predicted outer membrane lipoprotein